MDRNFRKLATAVIKQAVNDYVLSSFRLIQNQDDHDAGCLNKECVNFFRSDHFNLFCNGIDGTWLLSKLSAEMKRWGRNGKMTAPCKDCSRRHPNCNSECTFYRAYAWERKRILKIGYKVNRTQNDVMAKQVKRKEAREK